MKNETDIRIFANTTLVNEYSEEKNVIIISILREKCEILLEEMYEKEISSDQFPVIMVDIIVTFAYDSVNPKIYNGHYFIASHVNKYDYLTNSQFNSFVDLKYGESKYLNVEGLVMLFEATRLLAAVFETIKTSDADKLREELYRTYLDLPNGQVSVSSRNIALNKIFLCKFNDETDYDIVLNPYSWLDLYPFSPFVFIIYNILYYIIINIIL